MVSAVCAVAVGLALACGLASLAHGIREVVQLDQTVSPRIDERLIAQAVRREAQNGNAAQLDAIQDLLGRKLDNAVGAGADTGVPNPAARQVIAELSHSIGTPLAAISAVARRLDDELATTGDVEPESIATAIDRMRNAAGLCQAYLHSYRSLGRLEEAEDPGYDVGLADRVRSAISTHAETLGKEIAHSVELPYRLGGYSNQRVLAVVIPLVENAVENCSESDIRVWLIERHGTSYFHIENRYSHTIPAGFEQDSVSSKEGTGHGRGIVVSRRLAESLQGKVICKAEDGRFLVRVGLPEVRGHTS